MRTRDACEYVVVSLASFQRRRLVLNIVNESDSVKYELHTLCPIEFPATNSQRTHKRSESIRTLPPLLHDDGGMVTIQFQLLHATLPSLKTVRKEAKKMLKITHFCQFPSPAASATLLYQYANVVPDIWNVS